MYMGCRIGKEIFPMDKQIILPDEQPPSKPNKRRILLFNKLQKKDSKDMTIYAINTTSVDIMSELSMRRNRNSQEMQHSISRKE